MERRRDSFLHPFRVPAPIILHLAHICGISKYGAGTVECEVLTCDDFLRPNL
jgi:hypothetical protein